jgi:hypothetical protein
MNAGPTHEGFQSGRFGDTAGQINRAIAKIREKALAEYDKTFPEKDEKGNALPFQERINRDVNAILNGGGSSGAGMMAAVGNPMRENKIDETSEKNNDGEIKVIGQTLPGISSGGENTNLGFNYPENVSKNIDESNGKTAFDQFEIHQNEVYKEKSVSIFRLVSNRYLLQYDRLLNRREEIEEVKETEKTNSELEELLE